MSHKLLGTFSLNSMIDISLRFELITYHVTKCKGEEKEEISHHLIILLSFIYLKMYPVTIII